MPQIICLLDSAGLWDKVKMLKYWGEEQGEPLVCLNAQASSNLEDSSAQAGQFYSGHYLNYI